MTTPANVTASDYWSVIDRAGNEIPLQTYAFNITSWGGTRQAPPPQRGGNVTLPHVPGDLEQAQLPGARTITLGMWVVGSDQNGNPPTDGNRLLRFRKNWALLRRLLWNRGESFQLRKRFFDETGSLRVATATVRYGGGLAPESQGGPQRATFSVDLVLADPFFYGDPVNIPFDTAGTASWSGTVLGDYYSRRVSILGSAVSLNNPAVLVTSNGVTALWQVQAQGLGGTVSIDSPGQEALFGSDTYAPDVIHDSYNDWFLLPPDPSVTIGFTADGGSWSGVLTYYPTWL